MISSKKEPLRKKTVIRKKAVIEIIPAKASDADFICQLSGELFRIYGHYENTIRSWFDSETTVTLIARIERRPVGFAMIGCLPGNWNPGHFFELLAIGIEPERQRMGIGEMLIREIDRNADQMNIKRLFLHTATENLSAQKLFFINGYRIQGIKEKFYPSGQDAIMMSKEVKK
ncbi:MAG: N-acetyltransferase [Thermodesulfobacteriota bacterium]|nr:N-acetyltransferase [Thermodesulfobacteriota bacterium]